MYEILYIKMNCPQVLSSFPKGLNVSFSVFFMCSLAKRYKSFNTCNLLCMLKLYSSHALFTVPLSGVVLNGAHAVARFLCRLAVSPLYGNGNLEKAEVDHWLEYSLTQLPSAQEKVYSRLDEILEPRVYLVGYDLTIADLAIYGCIAGQYVHV